MWSVLHLKSRQPGTAVIYDMDQSEGTYAAAEWLHERFARVIIVTPRDAIAEETSLVTRQGINRRLSVKGIEVLTLTEPRWGDDMENEQLEIMQVYTGERTILHGIAFAAYATPRAPDVTIVAPLQAAGIDIRLIGDCLAPRNVMSATAEGHAAGNAL
jgi:hypothetical protein